ncbi:hypothetical protein NKDENANG_04176 [Candidatus Entotheonellaceae bacterium PAL068K]
MLAPGISDGIYVRTTNSRHSTADFDENVLMSNFNVLVFESASCLELLIIPLTFS